MPVIGRLDGQVDEVLIAPLEKRRRGGEARDEDHGERTEHSRDLEQRAPHDKFEKDAGRDELPVWLL